MASHFNPSNTLTFRALPDGGPITLSRPQYVKIVAYFFEQRERGRMVTTRELVNETDIDQAQSRLCEMRKLGFDVRTVDPRSARKGDQRKRYILADNIVRVENADGGDDA